MITEAIKKQLAGQIADLTGEDRDTLSSWFEVPPSLTLGDLALPCFRLSRRLKKAPQRIAEELVAALPDLDPRIDRLETVSGFLNVFFARPAFAADVLKQAAICERPGYRDLGKGANVIVEYSSPNIAKPFHVGHALTTILGEALARLYEYRGYRVVRLNHLGDYGTQFGQLIVAWQRWGDEAALEEDAIAELQRVYVKFHRQVKDDPTLEDLAREAFSRLERGEEEALGLWQRFRAASLEIFNRTYRRLNIAFDNTNGESFYARLVPDLMTWLREKGLLTLSEGAVVVNLDEYRLPPCLLIKSDGTSIYASRDLAAIRWRDQEYDFAKNIYVVGLPQKHHFAQVFAVMQKAGFAKAEACEHVAFGTVLFGDGRFSTREGNFIALAELLDESVAKTRLIIAENNPDMSAAEIDDLAEKVGLAAVRQMFLQNSREKDIRFTWEEALDFEGDTAPYLLYTLTRCGAVLNKAQELGLDGGAGLADYESLQDDDAFQLLCQIERFASVIDEALAVNEPSIVLRHAMTMARSFNRFYQHQKILFAESEGARSARLQLLKAVQSVLTSAVNLMGMEPVTRM